MNSEAHEVYNDLKLYLQKLPSNDVAFASSLVSKYAKWGNWSEKQLYWAKKMLALAIVGPETPKPAVVIDLGKLAGVYELFAQAKSKLKWPKLTLQLEEYRVGLSIAGIKAKHPGTITVTDGGPYGSNKFYGRISADGKFSPGRNMQTDTPEMTAIISFLRKLAADPHKVASEAGKLTGNCIFCSRALKQDKSVAVGYGETCARNWGLHSQWKAALKVAS